MTNFRVMKIINLQEMTILRCQRRCVWIMMETTEVESASGIVTLFYSYLQNKIYPKEKMFCDRL